MKLLVFAGAGTSVELGVPAMSGMATEFLAHSEQWDIEPEIVRTLMGDVMDIEQLIESVDQICSARTPLESLADMKVPLDRVDTIRSEVEWFVQHAAERITPPDAHLMWGPVLRATSNHDLTFVTTNYDRGIELAANAEKLAIADGFEPFTESEVARWIGFDSSSSSTQMVKIHGSTDWYTHRENSEPRKLRHPMPLFGRGTFRLSNGEELGSALVLPSREKLLTAPPYPRLTQTFLNAADRCEAAVFVGTSLRDPHIRDAASTIAAVRDLFIVNRRGDALGLTNASAIAQPASHFLISTLPSALSQPDPIAALKIASRDSAKSTADVLKLLRIATDMHDKTERRCDAIEQLDELSVTLDEYLVGRLLRDDDVTVARYALGLVSTSPARDSLVAAATNSPHASDALFAEELELLKQIAGPKN